MIDNNGKVHTIDQCEDVETGGKVSYDTRPRQTATVKSRSVRIALRRVAIMSTLLAILVAFSALVYYFLGWQYLVHLILVVIIVYIIVEKKYKWVYVALMTAPRDLKALYRYIHILLQMKSVQRKNQTIADVFRQFVVKHPNKVALMFEDQKWTFQQIEEYSNKVANIFKSHGYKKGDVVALFMENRPEYVCTWLGLSKLGIVVPLINTNLRLISLIHSITIAKSQAVVFGSELSSAMEEILEKIESTVSLYQSSGLGQNNKMAGDGVLKSQDLNQLLSDAASTPPNVTETVGTHDHLVYIYTSGTTGLPKAAVITHNRYMWISNAMHWMGGFKPDDVIYTPLPLYHTAGGCISVGQMFSFGSTIVLKKKFSASQYFPDCKKYEATICQYIGEMCRYVLAVPKRPEDTQHKLRIAYGNGLRPQIWTEFKERFNIEKIAEFYGATEGNANITNVDDTVGAVGFVSRIIPQVYPISIISVDQDSGDPIRNAQGLCMRAKVGEPGVFVGKITNNPDRAFLGYVDKQASDKKVIHDVFSRGDSAFISGDIMVADEFGYLYFKDRTGDTFRWKGENVSTSEVEAILSNITDYKDVVVYGVEIRGQEGRAGMAAILDMQNQVDLTELSQGVSKALPSYARPMFVRILHKLDMTGTYKMKKNDLQKDGFDPSLTKDNIYYLNSGKYSLVTTDVYDQINSGKIRL